MSDDPTEAAIRLALERRRPRALPESLLARVAAVPIDVAPLLPLPVRIVIGMAPWAALAAAALALASRDVIGPIPPTIGSGAPPPVSWSVANPGGGFAQEDWLGFPWAWFLAVVAIAGAVQTIRRLRSGRGLVPCPTLHRTSFRNLFRAREQRPWTGRDTAYFAAYAVLMFLVLVVKPWNADPIQYGLTIAPGIGITEIERNSGTWYDERADAKTSSGLRSGPQYVYRLRPGDPFSYIVTIRNDMVFPITLLGLRQHVPSEDPIPPGADYTSTGLGLLRDPARVSSAAGDVVPFQPVRLGAGEEVALVIASIAGGCADPTGPVPVDPPNVETGNRSVTVVYEMFGWRRVGRTWPPVEITVPVRDGCMPDPF